MAKKASKKQDDERAIEIDHLEPDLRKKAHDCGFRKRASINKVTRTLEHERWAYKLSLAFFAVMSVATIASIVARFVVAPDKKGEFTLGAGFLALWAIGSWAYMKRAHRHEKWLEELLAVVKAKLGK